MRLIEQSPFGDVSVSQRQLTVHKTTELLSVLAVPFYAYLVFNKNLPTWARLLSGVIGIGVIAVDGGLLATWSAKERGELGPWGGLARGL